MHTHDIIIIGAGASGLIAARELACEGYDVLVLEGSKRIGGRAFTFRDDKFPDWTETGAEFIHGKQKETIRLLKEYKIKLTPAKGKIWQPRFGEENDHDKDLVKGHRRLLSKKLKAVKRDLSMKKFLNAHFKGNEFTSSFPSMKPAGIPGSVDQFCNSFMGSASASSTRSMPSISIQPVSCQIHRLLVSVSYTSNPLSSASRPATAVLSNLVIFRSRIPASRASKSVFPFGSLILRLSCANASFESPNARTQMQIVNSLFIILEFRKPTILSWGKIGFGGRRRGISFVARAMTFVDERQKRQKRQRLMTAYRLLITTY